MDCGIPFCHNGCPLGNLIPEWNDLVYRSDWAAAADRLHATNNFPEFTGRLCPAPCEAACVLGINADPVTIKQVEVEIIDRAWADGGVVPRHAGDAHRVHGRRGRVRAGRARRGPAADPGRAPGDGLRARRRHRRAAPLRHPRVQDGKAAPGPADRADGGGRHQVRHRRAARRLGGAARGILRGRPRRRRAGRPRLPAPAATWPASTRRWSSCRSPTGRAPDSPISAAGKHVVIIGGGDTGADCLGTSHRQGAASVTQLEIMPRPPKTRAESQPWPTYPMIYRVSSAHEEGGDRVYAASTEEFVGDANGAVRALRLTEVAFEGGRFAPVPGTRKEIPCGLVLLAMGFTGAEKPGLLTDLGVELRRARQRGPRRLLPDVGARRVRGRRHGPRPVADRLGDRRGPQRRGRGRPVPARPAPPGAAVADPPDGASPGLTRVPSGPAAPSRTAA